MGIPQERLDRFEANRRRLFGVAYRLLGQASEAEDVVQDAYLRWQRADSAISPEAWLTKVVTNLCLDRLTSARVQREAYPGPWLPEPVADSAFDPLQTVEQRELLSLGVLVLLERLTPPERAVFVLREAFGHSHREIADILDVGEPHVRQLYRRAQQHVAAERKRFTPAPGRRRELLDRFLKATIDGDVPALEQMLAEDVTAWADGGGRAPAARRPLAGQELVVRNLLALQHFGHRLDLVPETVNGEPAVVMFLDGELTGVTFAEFDGERIVALRTVANPAKLAYFRTQRA